MIDKEESEVVGKRLLISISSFLKKIRHVWSQFLSFRQWFQFNTWNTKPQHSYIVETQNTIPFDRRVDIRLSDWKWGKLNTGSCWGSEEECDSRENFLT